MRSLLHSLLGLCCVFGAFGDLVEIKRIAEENVTLKCQHELGILGEQSLDIEWFSNISHSGQKVLISYSGGKVYDNDDRKGRYSFVSKFLAGDASIIIWSLEPSDAGFYTCKVKNAGKYYWNYIWLEVLVKPSEPQCWIDGDQLVGKNVTFHCMSSAGTKPLTYRWQRIRYEDKAVLSMPSTARLETQQSLLLQNLSKAENGSYQCEVANEAGKRTCVVHLRVQNAMNVGFLVSVICGSVGGVLLLCVTIWILLRKKELKKREEDEFLNEIREDAEAPKARLVKPGSSSSGSRSSRSGSSSTRSTTNSASRSQRTLSTQETSHGEPRHHCLDQI
ncbi:CXADR-like membrane protein [Spea bombifrons]|uniref:CXADR-like membrane protein n=1 Tax=Spea bombifrons TaxID=233779 RepID=UPI00234A350E|nr:CXADR-like membrane protein [Spea bombifrons]